MPRSYARVCAIVAGCVTVMIVLGAATPQHPSLMGYDDTPFLPGGKWRVHDGNRPQPGMVKPATCSAQNDPGQPPSDAIVLFDGKDLSKWRTLTSERPARWKVENGYMEVTPGAGDIATRDEFGDIQLHVEWRTPAPMKPGNEWQGNSGVFLFGLYELQVFESSRNLIYADGQAGAIYGQYPPLVNASRMPGEWQTFDVIFTAPRFDGDKLRTPAYETVFQNGVVIHNHTAILGETAHRALPRYAHPGAKGPIALQDHGDLVRFRNIWVRPLRSYDVSCV